MALIDLTGQRFTRLLVEGPGSRTATGIFRWRCRCDCGAERDVTAQSLRRGITQSCGCLQRSKVTTHGMSKSPEHKVWRDMLARCYRQTASHYERYGGRGIVVCDEWRADFMAFYRAMGPRPTANHTIERVDNDGDYRPGNCVWATQKVQCRNRCNTVRHEWNGKSLTLPEWAEELGLPLVTLTKRVKEGRPPAEVFSVRHLGHPHRLVHSKCRPAPR